MTTHIHKKMTQNAFAFLIADQRELLSPAEVAGYFGRSSQYVYDLIEEGKLEAHAPTGRIKKRYRITRRSALMHLAESAEYDAEELPKRLAILLRFLNVDQIKAHAAATARLIAGR